MKEKPEFVIEHAVKGMLPKTKMGKKVLGNLKIYAGNKHPSNLRKRKNNSIPSVAVSERGTA